MARRPSTREGYGAALILGMFRKAAVRRMHLYTSGGNDALAPDHYAAAVCPLAGSAGPACADVFKWVDERGVVNYGDRPPQHIKGSRPRELDVDGATVLPGFPKEELQLLRERGAQRRLRQLEAEVEELRARDAARVAAASAEQT